jgi:photosystem II stability/assembly factor-like uncharacterized protein
MSMPADAPKDSKSPWECLGPIAGGGTVSGLAISPVRRVLGVLVAPTPHVPLYWAATPCGSFRSYTSGYHWDQYLAGLTTPLLTTLAVAHNGALFAGALDGSLFLSDDFGLSWEPGHVPAALRAPVTAMAASPCFRRDRTVLAATDGAGVLVTRDGGRTWQRSSVHPGCSSALALAVTPDWSEQETVFAATSQGVYLSLDGGRAWHVTGLVPDDDVVDAIAVSTAFESDDTVYVGTEGGRLYHSLDGGLTWELLQARIGDGPVSSLWLARDFAESGRMVSAVGAGIYVSSDRGASWRLAASMPNLVLALAGDERSVIAGLRDAGVWESRDGGLSWAPASGDLAARGFTWLRASGDRLYAIGPQEGVWVWDDRGRSWANLEALTPHLPLTAFCAAGEGVLLVASHTGGILRSADGGETWQTAARAEGVQTLLLVSETGEGWAGTARGELLVSSDGGATWRDGLVPCQGQAILSIAASPHYARDRSLLMGTAIPAEARKPARVAAWRSADGGATWQPIVTETTSAGWLDIAMSSGTQGDPTVQAVLATGPYLLCPPQSDGHRWTSTKVDPSGANVLSVVRTGRIDQGEQLFAATGNGVFRSVDGGHTWNSFMDGLDPRTFMSLALTSCGGKHSLYALSLGGTVWRREL